MEITQKTNIGQLLVQDYSYHKVFEHYGIDFFCSGNRSIEEAAKELDMEADKIISDLDAVNQNDLKNGIDYSTWALDDLADYIEKSHHKFTEDLITKLKPLLETLVVAYGDKQTYLLELQRVFLASAGELASHMKKEELVLFPYIRKMVKAKNKDVKIDVPHFITVISPVNLMIHEHDDQKEWLRQIRELTNNYTLPEDPCDTFTTVYKHLKAFDKDMQKHLHLENNLLFPKAILLEDSIERIY